MSFRGKQSVKKIDKSFFIGLSRDWESFKHNCGVDKKGVIILKTSFGFEWKLIIDAIHGLTLIIAWQDFFGN